MTDILEATGLAKGGIYGNFKNKDDIALHAFDHSYNKIRDALRFKIREQATASGKLNAILELYHNYSVSPLVEGGCVILNTAIDADDTMPFLKQRAKAALNEMLGSLTYIIEKGIKSGEFDKRIKAKAEAEWIFATIEGGIMMSKLTDDPSILNRLLNNISSQVKLRYMS
jgi:AcrR family transcriptional regulator